MRSRTVWALAGAVALAGCTLNKTDLRRDLFQGRVGTEGRMLLPKRCDLTVQTVKAPQGEPGVDSAVWQAADEAVIDSEDARRTMEANGLRVGIITGPLPPELEKLIHAPPPHRVDKVEVVRAEGDATLIRLTPEPEEGSETSVLIHRQGRAGGKVYQDLRGHLRVAATQEGADGVSLRIVPELHHGLVQRRITADSGASPIGPQQFLMKDGQQEDTLRELGVTITLRPGQVAVIGCRSDRPSSLGHVLMTEPERSSDRLLQKVVLISARRSQGAAFGDPEGTEKKLVPSPAALQPIDADELPERGR